jgi:hypothetical protein
MFDIEKSFAEWRTQMLAAGIKTPVPLVELEIHLREDVEREMLAGTDAERAFERATRRFGLAREISNEFDKTLKNPARATNRNTFMHKRYLIANAVLWAAAILASAVIHAPVVFFYHYLADIGFRLSRNNRSQVEGFGLSKNDATRLTRCRSQSHLDLF